MNQLIRISSCEETFQQLDLGGEGRTEATEDSDEVFKATNKSLRNLR